jgi:hypothetical protein
MIHAGTIYPGIVGEFFTALEALRATDPALGDKLEVRLLGEISAQYVGSVKKLESLGIVKAFGLVPHAETLRMIGESDVLLIFMGGAEFRASHIPSKTFEYLQAEKTILALAGDGELANIARQSGLGIVVEPASVDDIAGRLRELLAARAAGGIAVQPNRDFIRAFERPALAAQLASVLDGVVERASNADRR